MSSYVRGKSKTEILDDLVGTGAPGSLVHEQQKAAITVRCTEDLEAALGVLTAEFAKNSATSEKLSRNVFWLNVAIAFATAVGAAATAVGAAATVAQALKH